MSPYAIAATLAVVLLTGCRAAPHETVFDGPTMGTTYTVKLATSGPLDPAVRTELDQLFADTLADINQKMSTYIDDSELSQFNRFGAGEPYAVSSRLLDVLQAAEDVFLASDGAFDPTVGPLVDLWGFGPAPTESDLPTEADVTTALTSVGWSKVRLDRRSSTVLKTDPSLTVDLSAIAKGYAVDELHDLLSERGYSDFLVEVGGELRGAGTRTPGGNQAWTVGIESPTGGFAPPTAHRIISLQDRALATSGDYRNFYEVDGQRYSHTIDPATGRPVVHRGASVSVVAETCTQADALATALLVMGPEIGSAWAEQHRIAALFLVYNQDNVTGQPGSVSISERLSPAMSTLLSDTAR